MKTRCLLIFLFLTLGLLNLGTGAEIDAGKATTTGNPDIPVDELDLLLRPLTRTELETEAQGWLSGAQGNCSQRLRTHHNSWKTLHL